MMEKCTSQRIKNLVSDTISSNEIYLTQQNYQHYDRSKGNTPSHPSDQESDEENFDDEI